jgi:hypothetical protein
LSESVGLVVGSFTNCVLAPYMGGFHVCGECSGRAGAGCWYLWSAALMYPGIDKSTVRFFIVPTTLSPDSVHFCISRGRPVQNAATGLASRPTELKYLLC